MADTANSFTTGNNNNNNVDGNGNVNSDSSSIRPKVQIRTNGLNGNSFNDKSPSPAAKLLISHGKPNFTIPRTKAQEQDAANPLSPKLQANGNHNYNPYKTANSFSNFDSNKNILVGTKFNGVYKPTKVTLTEKSAADNENEAAKVVLRRTRQPEPLLKEGEDENVPEFIRRQRRIQERLAKENVLDFENRRSGYFTHMMISPDSPNRTSFVETMSSPAIVPALEIPPPARIEEETVHELVALVSNAEPAKQSVEQAKAPAEVAAAATQVFDEVQQLAAHKVAVAVDESTNWSNGHSTSANDDVEPDVAQAIEEVNKAVAGEDEPEAEPEVAPVAMTAVTVLPVEHTTTTAAVDEALAKVDAAVTKSVGFKEPEVVAAPRVAAVAADVQVHTAAAAGTAAPQVNGHAELDVAQQNGHASGTANGHAKDEITISHTNGSVGDNPSIPAPDPSGALGVNYEPKTVVSFAQELGSGENKYPDTVKVVKDGELVEKPAESDNLQAMAKLKFEITGEQNDVQVTPVLKTE